MNVTVEGHAGRYDWVKLADLRRATGDMGVMSGLIATNAKELAALRGLGSHECEGG